MVLELESKKIPKIYVLSFSELKRLNELKCIDGFSRQFNFIFFFLLIENLT